MAIRAGRRVAPVRPRGVCQRWGLRGWRCRGTSRTACGSRRWSRRSPCRRSHQRSPLRTLGGPSWRHPRAGRSITGRVQAPLTSPPRPHDSCGFGEPELAVPLDVRDRWIRRTWLFQIATPAPPCCFVRLPGIAQRPTDARSRALRRRAVRLPVRVRRGHGRPTSPMSEMLDEPNQGSSVPIRPGNCSIVSVGAFWKPAISVLCARLRARPHVEANARHLKCRAWPRPRTTDELSGP